MADPKAAEKSDKRTLDRVRKLFEVHRELRGKLVEVETEIEALLSGEPTIADHLRIVMATWGDRWALRYHGAYQWNKTIEIPAVKRLIKALGATEVCKRLEVYLADNDAYYMRQRHPFGTFASQVNRFASVGDGELALEGEPPVGCKHQPPCASDAAHTRRRQQELRA